MKTRNISILLLGSLALTLSAASSSAQPDELFQTHVYSDTVMVEPAADEAFDFDVDLIVSGPEGFYHRESFPAGAVVEFDPSTLTANSLPDGVYHYELRIMGTGLDRVRGNDETLHLPAAVVADLDSPHSGTFSIAKGSFVSPDLDEPVGVLESSGKGGGRSSLETADADGGGGSRDQIINDDLIVTGSSCVGFDCINGESFGFDTIRMKENNLRLQFTDTSTSGSFPNRNWQIRANDSTNGGANYLGIIDQGATGSSESGTRLFTVSAGAPAHSLFVASTGRVGLRTSTPVLDLHANTGNSPGIRLEQNSSSGFTAQTWDMAGNEANFFIRDVTGGSRLPFRIRPGAPTSSIDIAADGDVGIGVANADAKLHVRGSNGSTAAIIEEASGTSASRQLFTLKNNGPVSFGLVNSNLGSQWRIASQTSGLRISLAGSGGTEFEVANDGSILAGPGATTNFTFDGTTGNLSIGGTLSQGSSKTIKTAIESLNGVDLIEALTRLDFAQWSYKSNPDSRHIGPMAEDFFNIFGLGESDKHIAPGDMAGIAMAASKHLALENTELKTKLKKLEQKVNRMDELESELNRMQAMIETLINNPNN